MVPYGLVSILHDTVISKMMVRGDTGCWEKDSGTEDLELQKGKGNEDKRAFKRVNT